VERSSERREDSYCWGKDTEIRCRQAISLQAMISSDRLLSIPKSDSKRIDHLRMTRYDEPCPSCGEMLSPGQTPIWQGGGFRCPACGRLLRTNTASLKWAWLITLFLSIGVCLLFGFRSRTAIGILLISSVPLSFVVFVIIGLVSSVPLELVPSKSKLQRHLARFDKKCPACNEVISPGQIPTWESSGFPCPSCGETLKSSVLSVKLTLPVSLTASLSACFCFGLKGLTFIVVSLITAVPLYFIFYAVIALIYPPGLELVSKTASRLNQ
jgi:predicted RNA-binding Zn-ribbon protein involved in translation (DUF1610 family)